MFKLKHIKRYKIGSRTVKVKWYKKTMVGDKKRFNGLAYTNKNLIKIYKHDDEKMQACFLLHEMIHMILAVMGENQSEKFVHCFAELLAQSLMTAE